MDCRLRDDGVGGERHDRIEVLRGERVFEVADVVRPLRRDQRKVAADRRFQEIALAAGLDDLLSLLHCRAQAGGGEHTAEAGTAGSDPFHERTLGYQLHLHFAGQHLCLGFRIEPDVRDDDAGDRAAVIELADTLAGHGGIVGHDREILVSRAATSASISRCGEPTAMKPPMSRTAPSGIIPAASSTLIAVFILSLPCAAEIASLPGPSDPRSAPNPRGAQRRRLHSDRLHDLARACHDLNHFRDPWRTSAMGLSWQKEPEAKTPTLKVPCFSDVARL